MTWFSIALIGPFLYAISNQIDKYLVEKYFKGGEAGALVIFSALFSIVALPFIFLFGDGIFSLGIKNTVMLTLNGGLNIICLVLYFKALRDDEATVVVPFYQLIPIFGFILGYLILGEVLTLHQMLACLLVIIGIAFLSFEIAEGKALFKSRVVGLMTLSSLLFAVNGVVYKFFTLEPGFWATIFWEFFGNVVVGTVLFVFFSSYRKQFIAMLKQNSVGSISVNSVNELVFLLAEGFSIYATLLAPIAIVTTINGFQPVFVFVIGTLMTLLFPKILNESLLKHKLIQKCLAIAIVVIGVILLRFSGVNY